MTTTADTAAQLAAAESGVAAMRSMEAAVHSGVHALLANVMVTHVPPAGTPRTRCAARLDSVADDGADLGITGVAAELRLPRTALPHVRSGDRIDIEGGCSFVVRNLWPDPLGDRQRITLARV